MEHRMELNVHKEVAAMQRLGAKQLRTRYAEVFGDTTVANNKVWLIRRIAWRLQALAEQANGKAKAPTSKLDAVKETLQKLGRNMMPLAIKDHLKKHYGIEISADVASNYKKKLAKQAKAAAPAPQAAKPADTAPVLTPPVKTETSPPKTPAAPAKKPALPAKKAAVPKPPPPAPQATKQAPETSGGNILLDDVLTAKELLDRVGADKLRTLIDGLAK
jgi:hypothetical protein